MTTTNNTKTDIQNSKKTNRDERISPDGKWRSFPKVPNLLQYVSTGLYFARLRVNGKLIRRSLKANNFTDAKLLLYDFVKKESKRRQVIGAPVTVGEAITQYESSLENDHAISEQSRNYRKNCVKRLRKSWPGLDKAKIRAITRDQCEKWSKLRDEVDAQYFNNILGTFKAILSRAGVADDADSPLASIKREGIQLRRPIMPTKDQFAKIVNEMETSGAGQQQACADFARFLAFSGCRLSEARAATWQDVDFQNNRLTIHNAKVRRTKSNWQPTRTIPLVAQMRDLLERLKQGNPKPSDKICTVGECEKSLRRACEIVGIKTLTHHDLRHLFATRSIESGVDIPTVGKWLGHADGGALALKIYVNPDMEKHSAEMGVKVNF